MVDGVPQLGEVEIELTREECDGCCPAYTVRLSGDGTLTYTGKSFVKTKGTHYDTFDPQRLLALLERFRELEFLDCEHECSVMVFDNSHARVALRIGARSNAVEDQVASREDTSGLSVEDAEWHRRMHELEAAIDAAANVESWIGTDAERTANRQEWPEPPRQRVRDPLGSAYRGDGPPSCTSPSASTATTPS
jgi:hypothetical protein